MIDLLVASPVHDAQVVDPVDGVALDAMLAFELVQTTRQKIECPSSPGYSQCASCRGWAMSLPASSANSQSWMKVSRAMALTARMLRDRKKLGLIVRARAMVVSGVGLDSIWRLSQLNAR
jgi:hypothetical protein